MGKLIEEEGHFKSVRTIEVTLLKNCSKKLYSFSCIASSHFDLFKMIAFNKQMKTRKKM
jgi:hypothetical protein